MALRKVNIFIHVLGGEWSVFFSLKRAYTLCHSRLLFVNHFEPFIAIKISALIELWTRDSKAYISNQSAFEK